ncbi:M14 family zinc carboxypeptidase, partial [Georgenia sp. 10Sc9-8]|nr:M14 family zinc carboxypeptidase [Georgenia halotolerans]
MPEHRLPAGAAGVLAAALVLGTVAPAAAAPSTAVPPQVPTAAHQDDDGLPYPRQTPLPEPEVDDADASIDRGAMPFHEIAPTINDLMAGSDLVSAEVVGSSTEGRDIYLVTVTAPETAAESAQQDRWRDMVKYDAAAAADDAALAAGYKVPIWFNGNIHGNEWEGTDATLTYIEDLLADVAAEDPAATELVEDHRLYFTVTNNPDGRVAGNRATALNLDPNRDFVTNTTPETSIIRDLAADLQPAFFVDLHGYTRILQVEPTGPPQGENYEHDLLMPHAYAAALQIEQDVVAADIEGNPLTDDGGIRIPYRDTPSGWDGWPPIFTAQYVAFQGAIAYTVELPLGRTSDTEESARRTTVNTEVGVEVIDSTADYVSDNAEELLGNQIEIFRRGAAGEPLRTIPPFPDADDYPGPDQWAEEWDEADAATGTTFPRAYVIPRGEEQVSETDAARLVDHLLAHGVEVTAATERFTLEGVTYPAGSYVVDMHQPLRGLANVLLADGSDISDRVPSMYDISAWSLGRLWGATVEAVGSTQDPAPDVATTPVTEAAGTASVPRGRGFLRLDVDGVAEVAALNDLLDRGVAVTAVEGGDVVLRPQNHEVAAAVAAEHGVTFTKSNGGALKGGRELTELQVGYTSSASYAGEDLLTLLELGFDDPVLVTEENLADGSVDLDDVDVLWLGDSLDLDDADVAVQLADYVADGKGFVGTAAAGTSLAEDLDVLTADVVSGPFRANGIVAVDTVDGGLLDGTARDAAFVYRPSWFTGLGAEVTVEQTYADDPLIAGHWLPNRDGS